MEATLLALQVGSGLIIGTLVGRALRAMTRFLMTVLSFYVASLVALSMVGVITINWEGLAAAIVKFLEWLGIHGANTVEYLRSAGPLGGSLAAGLILGLVGGSSRKTAADARRFWSRR